ncbi:MAG TPA: hypothetical protein VGV90_19330 [Solirubrobacteraceae bacterium]|nr:hypothetical protein [Solirubrobacteraceae bacterium]
MKAVLVGATVLLTLFAAYWLIRGDLPFADVGDPDRPSADEIFKLGQGKGSPSEFLYLDGARVDAYVSQFERGLATLEKTSASRVDKRTSEIAASPSKVAREVQAQDVFERTVTSTTASRMVNLLGYLRYEKDLRRLPGLAARDSGTDHSRAAANRFRAEWSTVRQGDFVQITAPISIPQAGRLYQIVRQVPETSATGTLGAGLRRAVGNDPRFPVAMTVDGGQPAPIRLIIPLQFSLLASESSLVVGKLTVIGKVLYRVPPRGRPFRDLQTWTRFRAAAIRRVTPDRLLARLRLTRRTMVEELRTYRRVEGPAAVILPIAIYK